MVYSDKKVTAAISWMAALTAGLIGLGLPLVYFGISYFYQDAALTTAAEINGRIVTRLINANPEMWRYEELRLMDVMRRRPAKKAPETRRILDLRNEVIVESVEKLDRPIHTRSAPLLDSGTVAGKIEISRSLYPLLERACWFSLLGTLLGLAAFYTLRILPVRMVRQAVLSLFEEKERAQVTLRSIADGVISTDGQGKVVLVNAEAEMLTGWSQQEAQGRHLHEVFHILDEKTRAVLENPVEQVLRQATVQLVNHTALVARDGTERIIANSGSPIRNAAGKLIGVVLVFRDVTGKQKLEAEMQKAGKLESLGILAGGIAHDFNNLLTVILGNISLAMTYTSPEDALHDRLVSAEGACLRARNLTYQLLTFSKGGAPVMETVSLPELIRSSSDFALTGSHVRPEINIADNLPSVKVDAGQINQVLHNLIINAVEAMPGEGGIITLRADPVSIQKNDALPLPEGEYVRISVQDQGTGVPQEQIPRIFDPYFTTKRWGSGLGLATSYSIIKNHGGHIMVDSVPGKGTTFHFYLPACQTLTVKNQEKEDRIIRGKGMILLMDDEELVRTVAGEMLKALGYEVSFAVDGDEAIDQYRKAQESGKRFDAVILDLTIPGGMGGKETIRKILELDDKVRAIVSSGYSENPVMSECSGYGFAGVLSKPYNVRQMSRVLHAVLHDHKKS